MAAEPGRWAVVEAAAPNDPGQPEAAALDGPGARAALAEGARGHGRWVAIRPTPLATAPSFDGRKLAPTPYGLRAFVVAGEDGAYRVLPGGLVRLAGAPEAVTLPNGFGSKDLWVTGAEPERHAPSILRASLRGVHLRRTGRDLLSRTADNLETSKNLAFPRPI